MDDFSHITPDSFFEYPDFTPPVRPATYPTTEQLHAWCMADDPQFEVWSAIVDEFDANARRRYTHEKAVARAAFEEAQKGIRKPKGKAKAVESSTEAPDASTAPIEANKSKNPRKVPSPCPTNLTLAQVAYWDNGPKAKNYDETGKRTNGGGQFKVTVQAYTSDPSKKGFDFSKHDWKGDILLRTHKEVRSSLAGYLRNGSITKGYHDELDAMLAATQARMATTKIGLFWHRADGVRFHPHQFVVLDIEYGQIQSGVMHLSPEVPPINLVFALRLASGAGFAMPTMKAQARYDATGTRPTWKTC